MKKLLILAGTVGLALTIALGTPASAHSSHHHDHGGFHDDTYSRRRGNYGPSEADHRREDADRERRHRFEDRYGRGNESRHRYEDAAAERRHRADHRYDRGFHW